MKSNNQKRIEEALGIIWHRCERHQNTIDEVRSILEQGVCSRVFEDVLKEKLIRVENQSVLMTSEGERIGRDVTRRHRLAERLLHDVLEVETAEIDKTACEFEHSISEDVADAICTLLGHPRECPHGSAIPPGPCCKAAAAQLEAIVQPLTRATVGETVRIAYIVTSKHPQLHKLFSLGIIPGTEVRLHQYSPSYIVMTGNTQIALDRELADKIYVRRSTKE